MKKFYPFPFLAFLVVITITLTSCLKDDDSFIKTELPVSATFIMKDSLKIADVDSSGPTADLYKRYNGKTYTINATDQVLFNVIQSGTGINFYFEDTSVLNLNPSFSIMLKNTDYANLASTYDLTDTSKVRVEQMQEFSGGLSVFAVDVKVLTGILKIAYNPALKTVSGELTNFKTLLGYHVTENLSAAERSANGILLLKGGSTRTVDLNFNNVPAK